MPKAGGSGADGMTLTASEAEAIADGDADVVIADDVAAEDVAAAGVEVEEAEEGRGTRMLKRGLKRSLNAGMRLGQSSLSLLNEFKDFIFKGNVIDLAVAVIVGNAFQAIVTSFANDILMPPLGLAIGKNLNNWFYVIKPPPYCEPPDGAPDNSSYSFQFGCDDYVSPNNSNVRGWNVYGTPADAAANGAVTINPGTFIQDIINFIVICAALFVFLKIILTMKLNAEKLTLRAKVKLLKQKEEEEKKEEAAKRKCDYCIQDIDDKATRCSHCGSVLPTEEEKKMIAELAERQRKAKEAAAKATADAAVDDTDAPNKRKHRKSSKTSGKSSSSERSRE